MRKINNSREGSLDVNARFVPLVPVDVPVPLSPAERARLLRDAGLALERLHVPEARAPAAGRWSAVLVADRIEEAYRVLARRPMTTRPRGYASLWPAYRFSFDDLRGQIETGELERLERARNRVRIPPGPAEIKASEEALGWPMAYLRDHAMVAKAVLLWGLWAATGGNVGEGCRRFGVPKRTFVRACMAGLEVIAAALNRARVPVE